MNRALYNRRNELEQRCRQILDAAEAENRSLTAEERSNYDACEADLDAVIADIAREERQAQRETEGRESANGRITNPIEGANEERTGIAAPEYRSAFEQMVRGGVMSAERRALQVGTDSEGGYLVPEEYERSLVDVLTDNNIVRSLAHVITTAGTRNIPVVASKGSAAWLDEEAAYTESDDAFSQVTLNAYKVGTLVKISEELLADSAFNMQAYLTGELGRRLAAAEEEAFITGNGSKKPTGLTASATAVTAAGATAITFDDIIGLVYGLKSQYRRNASFIMNDSTIKAVRKLKDSNGQYLWQPSTQAGEPSRILGYAVHTSTYMPEIAKSAKTILFGDYSYYWIADREGSHIQRLNELYAANGQVGFRGYKRVDGKLIVPEAVVALTQSAT